MKQQYSSPLVTAMSVDAANIYCVSGSNTEWFTPENGGSMDD